MLEGTLLNVGLEVSGRVYGIHRELDNYLGLVGIQEEGEGFKGGIFYHMHIGVFQPKKSCLLSFSGM